MKLTDMLYDYRYIITKSDNRFSLGDHVWKIKDFKGQDLLCWPEMGGWLAEDEWSSSIAEVGIDKLYYVNLLNNAKQATEVANKIISDLEKEEQ